MHSPPEVSFSQLLQKPKETVAKLNATQGHALRLERRGDEDLLLTTADRNEQQDTVTSAITATFVALMQSNAGVLSLLVDVAPVAFPWIRFLPLEGRRAFIVELVETMEAAQALEFPNPAPAAQVISSWRHTAGIHSNPSYAQSLHASIASFETGRVIRHELTEGA